MKTLTLYFSDEHEFSARELERIALQDWPVIGIERENKGELSFHCPEHIYSHPPCERERVKIRKREYVGRHRV